MSTTLAEPLPLNELDKEILAFWKLKNRYDHVHRFEEAIQSYVAELSALSTTPILTEDSEIFTIPSAASIEHSIKLDSSLSLGVEEQLKEECVVLSPPSAESPVIADLENNLETACIESPPAEPPATPEQPEVFPDPDTKPTPPTNSPTEQELAPPLETEEPDMWKIVHKKSNFFCKLVSPNGSLKEERGPFPDLEAARKAIGLSDLE